MTRHVPAASPCNIAAALCLHPGYAREARRERAADTARICADAGALAEPSPRSRSAADLPARIVDARARAGEDYRIDFEDGFGHRPTPRKTTSARRAAASAVAAAAWRHAAAGRHPRQDLRCGASAAVCARSILSAPVGQTGGAANFIDAARITGREQVAGWHACDRSGIHRLPAGH